MQEFYFCLACLRQEMVMFNVATLSIIINVCDCQQSTVCAFEEHTRITVNDIQLY